MPTSLPSCATLTALTTLTCSGLYEQGGLDARIYVGNRADISTVTETSGAITAITLSSGKKLVKFTGKPYVNSAQSEGGDLTANNRMYTHTVTWIGNAVTQAEIAALEALGNSRNLFAIVEKENGSFEIYGLDKNPYTGSYLDSRRGLMCQPSIQRSAERGTPNTAQAVFSASDMYGLPKTFAETASNSTNITALEALCV